MISRITCRNVCLFALLITTTVAVVVIGGCASTQQANLWMDPSYKAAPMKKILVIAMRRNQLYRRMWEDAIVAALSTKKHAGTTAIASYQLFPDDIPDTAAVRLKTNEEGFDGVLIVARAQRDSLMSDVPGYTTTEPITKYSFRWRTFVTRYEDIYHPGYTETETMISVRTDLLVPQDDGRLVWSVTSQSVDPASADQFRNSVASGVVSQLKKEQLVY